MEKPCGHKVASGRTFEAKAKQKNKNIPSFKGRGFCRVQNIYQLYIAKKKKHKSRKEKIQRLKPQV